ncbi:MAG: HlyD family efflux transporter periplasmic adaptor subunit [Gammaproteobacteria bacterium]|nr:HlyD family efflux transporter periplasmic adaptor subunit [Gammaproteobacteria bacterium]
MALIDYSWQKAANAKPRLSGHVQVERHFYRGRLWYVLYDQASGRSHRITPAVHHLLCLMDGERTLEQVWEVRQKEDENAPSKDEILRAFSQLQTAELLHGKAAPGAAMQEERRKTWKRLRRRQRYGSPLSVRIALWDPDKFLVRMLPGLRMLFSPLGLLIWLGMVLWGTVLAAQNWEDLTHDVADHVLAPDNLIIMFFLFPAIKLLHELGHAFTARRWGGEVHEMGILFLVFMPIPYVEASSASAFVDKRARMAVSGAGIMVELFVAALAMMLWVSAEPGLVRAMAYNLMFIASISTLLFNGNPLLRFDGYYLLADALEIPNLGPRANRYIGYLFQRYLLGVKGVPSPAESRGEAGWLLFYGVAAFCYRIFISVVIILFVAGKFFIFGVFIAVWAAYLMFLAPLIKNIRYLLTSPVLRGRKRRAVLVLGVLASVLFLCLFRLPVPVWRNAQGVIWPPEQSQVRTGVPGFCQEVPVRTGDRVEAGTPLMVLADEQLETEYRVLQSRLDELEAKYKSLWRGKNRSAARMLRDKIDTVEADAARKEEMLKKLVVRSPQAGRVYLPNHDRILGRFLPQGELVAHVVEPPVNIIRAVVEQEDIALVRQGRKLGEGVEIRLAERPQQVYSAVIVQAAPAASKRLPHRALGTYGGGPVPVDPTDEEGLRAYEAVFQFEVRLPDGVPAAAIGGRAYLRFYHGKESLVSQWYRSVRQLFLRRFAI